MNDNTQDGIDAYEELRWHLLRALESESFAEKVGKQIAEEFHLLGSTIKGETRYMGAHGSKTAVGVAHTVARMLGNNWD